MKVAALIKQLKRIDPDLEIYYFAHDQDPDQIDQAETIGSVREATRCDGVLIAAIQA